MKKFLSISVFLLAAGFAHSQSVPERVAALINANDFYALEQLDSGMRASLPPLLMHLTDAVTGSRFNRLPESCAAIGTLLNDFSGELDGPTQSWLFGMLVGNLRLMNAYDQAGGIVGALQQMIDPADTASHATLDGMQRMFGALAARPRTRLARPAGDVTLPLHVATEHIRNALGEPADIRVLYTDVRIGDTTERFIFDTGCSHASFVSQEFADRHGIRTLCDSILVSGAAKSGYARLGALDSMRVGPVTVYDPTFIITPSFEAVDTLYKVNAVLGTDFMTLAGEVRMLPGEGRIVLPAIQAPRPAAGSNLSVDTQSGQYALRALCDGEPVTMVFDTGCMRSSMTDKWYAAHEQRVLAEGRGKEMGIGGFGGVVRGYGYILPALRFAPGGPADECTLHDIEVASDFGSRLATNGYDGWLGADFILCFDEVTINFDRMFVTAAKKSDRTASGTSGPGQ